MQRAIEREGERALAAERERGRDTEREREIYSVLFFMCRATPRSSENTPRGAGESVIRTVADPAACYMHLKVVF